MPGDGQVGGIKKSDHQSQYDCFHLSSFYFSFLIESDLIDMVLSALEEIERLVEVLR